MPQLRHRVIAFEGVDGAGKSTVIAGVAEALRARGHRVHLPRTGKEHDSRPTRMIRRLTRDPRNLELSPVSELLLYAAREAQIIAESIRPSLDRGEVVLLDRSLLTPLVLGHSVRGVARELCQRIVADAAQGFAPDLTLVFDVHPRTSRIRKRIAKVRANELRQGGRKGLSGSQLKLRQREGYLAWARQLGLPVISAESQPPNVMIARALAVIDGADPGPGAPVSEPEWLLRPSENFQQALTRLAPATAIYLSRGLACGRGLRARWADDEPNLVAWASDYDDPLMLDWARSRPKLGLRHLARRPLGFGFADGTPDPRTADQMPGEFGGELALSLRRLACQASDRMRSELAAGHPGPVFESLQGRSDPFARELRAQTWSGADAYSRGLGLMGCDGDEAWKFRAQLFESHPHLGLTSLRGLVGPRVQSLFERWAEYAPKLALRALHGRGDAEAYAWREALWATGREVVDSLRGLDDAPAWRLRERALDDWPSTVAWSLLGLLGPSTADSQPVQRMLGECRTRADNDMHLHRRLIGLEASRRWPAWVLGAELDPDE